MSRRLSTAFAGFILFAATVACDGTMPPTENGVSSSAIGASGTPTSVATRDTATPTPIVTSTTPASSVGPIRTPDEAAARALTADSVGIYASENVTVRHVEWMTLGEAWAAIGEDPGSDPTDPATVVWWVNLSGTFHIWSCPAPPPGTPNTGCGTSSAAEVILAASDGRVFEENLGERRFPATPTAISHQIPSDAKLQTPGAAIDAGFQTVPGKNDNPPTLDSLRLMTYRQWLDEQEATRNSQTGGIDANTPVWQVEFSDADFMPPCSIPGGCHIEHVFVAFTPISIQWWSPGPPSPTYPPVTPSAATPASSPAVMQNSRLPDALALHNSSGDHVSVAAVAGPPRMTVEDAMAAVAQQVPWGSGGSFGGKPITVQAWYGMVDIGNPGLNGTWGGSANIPLPSGGTLPNLRGRLVWLIDYGNVPGIVSSTCPGCAPPPVYDHDVYAVDDETGAVLWWASNKSP